MTTNDFDVVAGGVRPTSFISFVVEGALRELAEQSVFPEPVDLRAVLHALTGYGEAG